MNGKFSVVGRAYAFTSLLITLLAVGCTQQPPAKKTAAEKAASHSLAPAPTLTQSPVPEPTQTPTETKAVPAKKQKRPEIFTAKYFGTEVVRGYSSYHKPTIYAVLLPQDGEAYPLLEKHPEHLRICIRLTDEVLDNLDLEKTVKDGKIYSLSKNVDIQYAEIESFDGYHETLTGLDPYDLEAERETIVAKIKEYRRSVVEEARRAYKPMVLKAYFAVRESNYNLKERTLTFRLAVPEPDRTRYYVDNLGTGHYWYESEEGGHYLCTVQCSLPLDRAKAFFAQGVEQDGDTLRVGFVDIIFNPNQHLLFQNDRMFEWPLIQFPGFHGFVIAMDDFEKGAKKRGTPTVDQIINQSSIEDFIIMVTPSKFFDESEEQPKTESGS